MTQYSQLSRPSPGNLTRHNMTIKVKIDSRLIVLIDYNQTCRIRNASLQVKDRHFESRSLSVRQSPGPRQDPPPLNWCYNQPRTSLSNQNLGSHHNYDHHQPNHKHWSDHHQSTCWSSGQGKLSIVLQSSWPACVEQLIWWLGCLWWLIVMFIMIIFRIVMTKREWYDAISSEGHHSD